MRVSRLPLLLIGAVTVFTLVVGGILVSRVRSRPVEPAVVAPRADLVVKEVNIREESGRVQWHLTAQQAEVFEQEGRTSLREVAVSVQQPERSWTVKGDEGDLYPRRNDLEIRSNVVLTSSDGLRLETSRLRWTGSEKRLWTDTPVTLTNGTGVIRGSGLDIRMAEETAVVSGRVRAVFTGRADR